MKLFFKIFSLATLLFLSLSASAGRPTTVFEVSPKSLSFTSAGGTKTISVTARNIAWTILSKPAGWVTATKSANSVTIKVTKNASTSSRSTSIKLGYGQYTHTVKITQSGASPAPKPHQDEDKKAPTQPAGKAVETFTVKGVTFEMVRVDGGSFMMGSDDSDAYDSEKPVHRETVKTFYIGRTEVTQALWEAVMGSNPSCFKGANLPVERVSWDDCKEFIGRLNRLTGKSFRLPTEAEWEYAARGGNRSEGYKYSGSNELDRVGWYRENNGGKTHPVATKLDNELGLYDMSGNVWEWTSDKYSSNYNSTRNSSCRVVRGGGWDFDPRYCRSALRFNVDPSDRDIYLGFRLAL